MRIESRLKTRSQARVVAREVRFTLEYVDDSSWQVHANSRSNLATVAERVEGAEISVGGALVLQRLQSDRRLNREIYERSKMGPAPVHLRLVEPWQASVDTLRVPD